MTKREQILLAIAVAAREGNITKATRLYLDNRCISKRAFEAAAAKGHEGRVAAGKA